MEEQTNKEIDWELFATSLTNKTIASITNNDKYHETQKCISSLKNEDRLSSFKIIQDKIYSFSKIDKSNFGKWRRVDLYMYTQNPNCIWEVVIDFDELNKKEGKEFVFSGSVHNPFDSSLCLIKLSEGGTDAIELREFDLNKKKFCSNGFLIKKNKTEAYWFSENELIIATNFNRGVSKSSYPIEVCILQRGDLLENGRQVFNTNKNVLGVWPSFSNINRETILTNYLTIHKKEFFLIQNLECIKIQISESSNYIGSIDDNIFFQLKDSWKEFKPNDIISFSKKNIRNNLNSPRLVFSLKSKESICYCQLTQNYIVVYLLRELKPKILILGNNMGKWKQVKSKTYKNGAVYPITYNINSDVFFYQYESFSTPPTIYFINIKLKHNGVLQKKPYKKAYFEQDYNYAISADSTKIPYILFYKKGNLLTNLSPTIINVYGGFEISNLPFYDTKLIDNWINKGGVYVIANVRGGGEFGAKWHQEAVRENKQKTFDDLYVVTEDLIKRGITNPQKIGLTGGSNGGLVVNVAFVQRPDLYRSVFSDNALIDMLNYHKYDTGAAYIGEFGNPENDFDKNFIKKYDPITNLKKATSYPMLFLYSSKNDDRVNCMHSRIFAKKLNELKFDFLFFESKQGGHSSNLASCEFNNKEALFYTFFKDTLMS